MVRTLIAFLALSAPACAAGIEVREYRISVDGRPAGSYYMTIEERPDGTLVQTGRADVTVRVLFRTFTYAYRGKETWRENRLVAVESHSNDDGKQLQLRGEATPSGLHVVANGRTSVVPADVWTMSYWRLPPKDQRPAEINLLDTDTGRIVRGRLQLIGPSVLAVAGTQVTVNRYSLTGGAQASLWFDTADRLVRQESIEEGHRTAIELVKVSH